MEQEVFIFNNDLLCHLSGNNDLLGSKTIKRIIVVENKNLFRTMKGCIKYLDMSNAFDKVGHAKLLGRLYQYGITGKLHDWFRSCLQGSNEQVFVLGVTSRNNRSIPGYHKGPF